MKKFSLIETFYCVISLSLCCNTSTWTDFAEQCDSMPTTRQHQEPTPSFESYLKQGKQSVDTKDFDSALHSFKQALSHMPDKAQEMTDLGNALLNLGNIFFNMRKTDKALEAFNAILSISDTITAAHHNLAFTIYEQVGDFKQAISHYKRILELNPNAIESHFCLALAYLANGDLENGFKEYEYRWKRTNDSPRSFTYPLPKLWDGKKDIAGKRVLIRVEQGLGDTLQFIRYAKELKKMNATVIAEVQKPLVSLLSLVDYLDEIIPFKSPVPEFDYQIPMLNLPLAFNTTLQTIPAPTNYLRASPALIKSWHSTLAADTKFKIGICWEGDKAHGPSKFMPLRYFTRLAHLPKVSVYSLQKNQESDPAHAQKIDPAIKQFGNDFDTTNGSFMDTAAIMKNLDLVITVDTSIAHLAGGLDIPVWIVLPFPAEWRWLTERSDSPWYPTMRLFRQTKFGDWEAVFSQIVEALAKVKRHE